MKCNYCGKFVRADADRYIPYGCANPAEPEPFDDVLMCEEHAERYHRNFIAYFSGGGREGDWVKSEAEKRAAQEFGLTWVPVGESQTGKAHYK